ncbi:MAG: hypothetical protein GXP29_13285 [Planctomycetes bacterium]|nr:hypothetical protein [Planctomycetota bacterium]
MMRHTTTRFPCFVSHFCLLFLVTCATPFSANAQDCNNNGNSDFCDVDCQFLCPPHAGCGQSLDLNNNGIPDECELDNDCNLNGIPDPCDLDCISVGCEPYLELGCGQSFDSNDNGEPDECENDCNSNSIPDLCDLSCDPPGLCGPFPGCGASADCNANGRPDECEIGSGDIDGDADVDLDDYAILAVCLTGPCAGGTCPPPGGACCEHADLDQDGDIDLHDFSAFVARLSG